MSCVGDKRVRGFVVNTRGVLWCSSAHVGDGAAVGEPGDRDERRQPGGRAERHPAEGRPAERPAQHLPRADPHHHCEQG